MGESRQKPVSAASLQFAKNTKKLMDTHSLSYDRLSEITGVSKGNLHRLVNGQSEISLKVAKSIIQYFHKSLDDMIEREVKV